MNYQNDSYLLRDHSLTIAHYCGEKFVRIIHSFIREHTHCSGISDKNHRIGGVRAPPFCKANVMHCRITCAIACARTCIEMKMMASSCTNQFVIFQNILLFESRWARKERESHVCDRQQCSNTMVNCNVDVCRNLFVLWICWVRSQTIAFVRKHLKYFAQNSLSRRNAASEWEQGHGVVGTNAVQFITRISNAEVIRACFLGFATIHINPEKLAIFFASYAVRIGFEAPFEILKQFDDISTQALSYATDKARTVITKITSIASGRSPVGQFTPFWYHSSKLRPKCHRII